VKLDSPTLASLRFFEAAARFESFKRAAGHLNVTQGAVSQQVKHLERKLGVRLFQRLPHSVKLTESGQRLFRVVERTLREIVEEMETLTDGVEGQSIRIRTNPSFAVRWLVPRLGDYHRRHPSSKLEIRGEYGEIDPERRNFDVAIESAVEPPRGYNSDWLMDEFLIVTCSPGYLADRPWLKGVDDLHRCELLHDAHPWADAQRDAEWRFWLDSCDAEDVVSDRGQFFSLAYMAIEAALGGQGVAIGRKSLVADLIEDGRLLDLFGQTFKAKPRYWLLRCPDNSDDLSVTNFVAWLRSATDGLRK
jgi:DNA-binding transcriptional LysR family regulator